MRLSQLKIQNFRNLENIEFIPDKGVNLILGRNASGKTSLLESIYYLSHIRSFRTHIISELINRDHSYLQLIADIETSSHQHVPLGIRRSRSRSQIKLNRQIISRVSDITVEFPVLAIHPDSYKLITGSPSQRRQYLDWGVFHVEQGFFQAWKRFKKAMLQRNAALKTRQSIDVCKLWHNELNQTAEHIDQLRHRYFENLNPCIKKLASQFFPEDNIEIEYKRGWPSNVTLLELLDRHLDKDRIKGFTRYGPHRADINIRVNDQSAQTCISRGQQKTLVALMRLAQAMQFTDIKQTSCILLYDDLAAELDAEHRAGILSVLSTMNIQLFLTAIEKQQIDLSAWRSKTMFHVEHGTLCKL